MTNTIEQAIMTAAPKATYLEYSEDEYINVRYQFSVITSEELNMNSQVTEYVVEDGSMRQEHVVRPPIEFTLQGIVAEKAYWIEPQVVGSFLTQQTSKLQPIAALLPEVSSYAQTAVAGANYIEKNIKQAINKVKNLKKLDLNKNTQEKMQKRVAQELIALRDNITLVKVSSDFGTFENMLIESVQMTQEDTYDQCQLVVKLKQYNSVATELTYVNTKLYSDRVAQQAASEQNLGRIQGSITSSTLRNLVPSKIVPQITGINDTTNMGGASGSW